MTDNVEKSKSVKNAKAAVKPKKHHKVIRDSIQGITKPAISRICKRAGVKRINGMIFEEVRGVTKVMMENILKDTIAMTEHNRRHTVKEADLVTALQVKGIYLEAGINPNTPNRTFDTCKARPRGKGKNTEGGAEKTAKPHRFKPGTVALREIRYQQKHSDCFAIPKTNFGRLAREISQDFATDLRFSGAFMELFQVVIEDQLVTILKSANLLAIHAGRLTVKPKDLQLARVIRGDRNS